MRGGGPARTQRRHGTSLLHGAGRSAESLSDSDKTEGMPAAGKSRHCRSENNHQCSKGYFSLACLAATGRQLLLLSLRPRLAAFWMCLCRPETWRMYSNAAGPLAERRGRLKGPAVSLKANLAPVMSSERDRNAADARDRWFGPSKCCPRSPAPCSATSSTTLDRDPSRAAFRHCSARSWAHGLNAQRGDRLPCRSLHWRTPGPCSRAQCTLPRCWPG